MSSHSRSNENNEKSWIRHKKELQLTNANLFLKSPSSIIMDAKKAYIEKNQHLFIYKIGTGSITIIILGHHDKLFALVVQKKHCWTASLMMVVE